MAFHALERRVTSPAAASTRLIRSCQYWPKVTRLGLHEMIRKNKQAVPHLTERRCSSQANVPA